MYTNDQIRKLAQEYLDNGDFTVSGYAMIEKAGVEFLAQDGDLDQDDINYWMSRRGDEYERLSDWAYELATGILSQDRLWMLYTLDMGQGEQRARWGEMNNDKRFEFVRLWLKISDSDTDGLLRAVPAAIEFLLGAE